jgi:hypothetical protein
MVGKRLRNPGVSAARILPQREFWTNLPLCHGRPFACRTIRVLTPGMRNKQGCGLLASSVDAYQKLIISGPAAAG